MNLRRRTSCRQQRSLPLRPRRIFWSLVAPLVTIIKAGSSSTTQEMPNSSRVSQAQHLSPCSLASMCKQAQMQTKPIKFGTQARIQMTTCLSWTQSLRSKMWTQRSGSSTTRKSCTRLPAPKRHVKTRMSLWNLAAIKINAFSKPTKILEIWAHFSPATIMRSWTHCKKPVASATRPLHSPTALATKNASSVALWSTRSIKVL